MTSQNEADEEQIFNTARRISDVDARAEYLDSVCPADSSLRARIEGLLKIHEQERTEGGPKQVDATVDGQQISLITGQQIGPYKLLEKIGEGGFGVVYMAEQLSPVRRRVALKVIKAGMDTKEVIARFEAERQALALMDHPNIAKVLDAGATEQQRPYFVMELVNGVPITDFCNEAKLQPRDRLDIFVTVCKAVQHAHQKGVIHRDLKPSNVLVTLHGEEPVPVVIDFGVAKATSQPLTEKTLFTRYGQMVGTPQYMSPEQSGVSGLDVDTRSDVYSLGVLLYELITGTTPLEAQRLRSAAYAEIAKLIQEEEPPKLSTRLSSLSDRMPIICKERGTDQKKLLQSVRGDLDWIAMKAIEKDRSRRYETASALGEDIARFLSNEPVVAGPPSTWYRYQKLFQRNRRLLTTAALFLVAVLLGLVGTSVGWRQASVARGVADERYEQVELARGEEKAAKELAEEQRGLAQRTAEKLERELYSSRIEAIHVDLEKANLKTARSMLKDCPAHLRHWEWEHLSSRAQRSYQKRLAGYLPPQFNGKGEVATTMGVTKQNAVCWDSSTGELVWEFQNPEQGPVDASGGYRIFAVSHDHSKILGHNFETMKLWDRESGKELWPHKMDDWGWYEPRFSPDDTEIARLYEDMLEVHSAKDGSVLGSRHIGGRKSLEYSPDGSLLLAGNLLLDAKDLRRVVARIGSDDVRHGAISPSNDQVLTGHTDGQVRLWDVSTGKLLRELDAHQNRIDRVCFGPTGQRIASVGDATVRVGDLTDPDANELSMLGTHDGFIMHVAFTKDGRTLATSGDGLYLWDPNSISSNANFVIENIGGRIAAFSPDGQQLVSAGSDATIRIWDVATGQEQRWFECNGHVSNASYNHDGSMIAAVVSTKQRYDVVLFNSLTGEEINRWCAHDQFINSLEISPQGDLLATASADGTVCVWTTTTGQLQYKLRGVRAAHEIDIAFSSDGQLFASCGQGVTIYEAETGKSLCHLEEASAPITFRPDGLSLACKLDNRVALVDVSLPDMVTLIPDSSRDLKRRGIAFSPDGKRMWAISSQGALNLFDCQYNAHLATFDTDFNKLESLSVSPDGKTVATGTSGGHVILWEVGDRSSKASERHLVSRARRLADGLYEKLTFSSDVAAAIRKNSSLDESVRRTALQIVAVRGDNAYRLNNSSEKTVRSPRSTADDYALALKMAKASTSKLPDCTAYVSTLGIAHYRVGDYKSAVKCLSQARTTASPSEDRFIVGVAFLAMAHAGLGDRTSSLAALDELQQALETDAWSVRDDIQALLDEVQENLRAAGIQAAQQ